MKTEAEIREELKQVRTLMRIRRVLTDNTNTTSDVIMTLYGAQQALGWVLGELISPSEWENMVHEIAMEFDR